MTAIAFFFTRESECTEQDWEKLSRLVDYLKRTIDDEFSLGADGLDEMGSFVDVSFAVHEDMRSHTCCGISFGRGIILGRFTMQKFNTNSSTELELVCVADYLPNVVWMIKFWSIKVIDPRAVNCTNIMRAHFIWRRMHKDRVVGGQDTWT